MGEAVKRATLLAVGLLIAGHVHNVQAARTPQRRVAVAQFDAPSESRARNAVLAALSEHAEVDVVSLEDIAFAGKHLKADPSQPEGRAKISAELGIDAWIDGKVDGSEAEIRMTSVADQRLVRIEVRAPTSNQLDQIVGEKTWAAVGPKLSERERARRALLAQAELARQKIAAREAEVERQVGLARQHAQERVERLQREQELAVKKQAAFVAELNRQKQLVQDRLARDVAEQQQLAEARRQAEMQRLAAAQPPLVQQPAAPAYAAPAQSAWAPAQSQWAPAAATNSYHGVPAGQGWSTQAAPATSAGGVSPSTQQWLQSQSPAPAQQPGFAGVSPATQRWLAQQQMH
jgi:hypothetical protein